MNKQYSIEEVITIAESLIQQYKKTMKRHEKYGHRNMANSVKGSIIGVVQLLSQITDNTAEDYFREIFPEEYGGIE